MKRMTAKKEVEKMDVILFIAGLTIGIGIGLVMAGIREYILERRKSKY